MQTVNKFDFTVFFGGVLSHDRGLPALVAAVQNLESVKLVVAGFGPSAQEFSDLIQNKRNVEFLGRIPHNTVLKLTFLYDCVVALYDPLSPIISLHP